MTMTNEVTCMLAFTIKCGNEMSDEPAGSSDTAQNKCTADPIRLPLAGNGVGLRESDACIELAAHLSAWRACAFLRAVSSTSLAHLGLSRLDRGAISRSADPAR
eukprot:scaffold13340_cov73-Skeletonema_marinoi.AAC.3